MKGFIYNGKSTEDIIDVPLLLCSLNGAVSSVAGQTREVSSGEQTLTRTSPNEYGVLNSLMSFEYGLIKYDGSYFTTEEQIAIEAWLTSPKFSSDLYLFDCNDTGKVGDKTISDFYYSGKFLSTEWIMGNDYYFGVTFNFQCNTACAFKKYSYSFDLDGESGSTEITINCPTFEYEEYVYPEIQYTQNIVSGLQKDFNFIIESKTDDNATLKAIVESGKTLVIDCQNCIPWDYIGTSTNGTRKNYPYSDLGWEDVGNIYFPRLAYGDNVWNVTGNGTLQVTFDCPYKRVGGWL